jgi:hypothetical protein
MPYNPDIDINEIKISIITRVDVTARTINNITRAFVYTDDYSVDALVRYHVAISDQIATLQGVQNNLRTIVSQWRADD